MGKTRAIIILPDEHVNLMDVQAIVNKNSGGSEVLAEIYKLPRVKPVNADLNQLVGSLEIAIKILEMNEKNCTDIGTGYACGALASMIYGAIAKHKKVDACDCV